jgi:hypothetical protein
MPRSTFLKVMDDANRLFCERYTGNNGGLQATKLSLYPFMKEIRDKLFESVTVEKVGAASPRLTLFSGHDTVIAPVLAALGVYHGDMCVWPPYASRIVFELYISASAYMVAPFKGYSIEDARSNVMIRVLYNGEYE